MIRIVNAETGALEQTLEGHTDGVVSVEFSPDGKHLVFASNRASKPGTWDTNLFVAAWQDTPAPAAP